MAPPESLVVNVASLMVRPPAARTAPPNPVAPFSMATRSVNATGPPVGGRDAVQLVDAREDAERERDRADGLMMNALPAPIANELKRTGRARPVSCASATVLFTDFKGFTALAEVLSPEALVAELEEAFSAYDEIVDRHGVEKLKTIGDAYMALGGLPIHNDTHPIDCVRAAMEMAAWTSAPRGDRPPPPFEVRIGIHTGPLVAGVIGKRRFLYDIWGDTVNTASRMESSGVPGRVNMSAATWELVRDPFTCTHRGQIEAKGKGMLDMYLVEPGE